MEPIIKTKNLSKQFTETSVITHALTDINFTLTKGEFVSIMGPSGCGKTSLLNILGMIDSPSSGSYTFDGIETTSLSERKLTKLRKGNIGFIFQSFNLIDELTVLENIEIALQYIDISRKDRKMRTEQALESVKLSHKRNALPQHLSGGQQQKIAIARSIAIDPRLILADEPTGNLDSQNGKEIMDLLQMFHEGGTSIIMVTHSERDASYAQRKITLFDGKIINGQ